MVYQAAVAAQHPGARTRRLSGDQARLPPALAPAFPPGAPAMTGDANTDYNAAGPTLVKDASRG